MATVAQRFRRVLGFVPLGLFTGIGLAMTALVAIDWLQGLDTWTWQESTCTITSSAAAEEPRHGEYAFEVSYRYRHRGVEHLGDAYRHSGQAFEQRSDAEVLASRYPVGSEVRCWIDPDRPGRAYLRRANLWRGLWILVPLMFVAVGVGAIWLLIELRREGDGGAGEDGGAAPGWTEAQAPQPKKPRVGVLVGGMFFLFGAFFLFGTGIAVPFFLQPALEVVLARSWQPVPCEILASGVRAHPGEDGATYSIDVLYRYEIGGREYRANRYQFMGGSSSGYERRARIVEDLEPGAATTCWVDPNDPHEAVIERGFTSDSLFGLMPLLFAAIGLGGLVFAVGVHRAARRDAGKQAWAAVAAPSSWSWSGGPEAAAAAGAGGPMVLEPVRGPLGKLGCTILAALFWNGFISIFVWHVVQEWQAGNPQWVPALILAPFALIGLAILSGIPYSVLALLNPRPRLHLSPGAVPAGGSAQLEWAFRGAAGRVRHLRIRLEATEARTEQTDSGFRIETSALEHPGIPILDRGRELPLEYGAVSFTVPAGTPPTSDGETAVRWQLKLHGEIAYWPDVATEYEVRILPAADG